MFIYLIHTVILRMFIGSTNTGAATLIGVRDAEA